MAGWGWAWSSGGSEGRWPALLVGVLALVDLALLLGHTRLGGQLGLAFLGFSSRAPWLVVLGVHLALLGPWFAPERARALARAVRSRARATSLAAGLTLLAGALLLRVGLTASLGVPDAGPDTPSYVAPALEHPALPFSEMRTAGTPTLVALAHRWWGHPVGVLWLHHGLWLASTIAVVGAVRQAFRSRGLALALLAYLCLCEKNLAFEFLLLSEHAARAFNALLLAAALWYWCRPSALRAGAVTLALLASAAVKPTVVFMLPGVAALFLWPREGAGHARRGAAHLVLVLAACVVAWSAYSAAYARRFGYAGTNAVTFMNLYAHVGHLTHVETVDSPALAADLARLIPQYREHFADRGDHQPNWLIYGSSSPELRARFGDDSPAAAVERERQRAARGDPTRQRGLERIYRELTLAGIRAHPAEYAAHALGSAWSLYARGLGGSYRWDCLAAAAGDSGARAARDERIGRDLLPAYDEAGRPRFTLASAAPAQGGAAGAFRLAAVAVGALAACLDLGFVLSPVLVPLLLAASCARSWRARHRRRLLLAASLALCLGGYALGIGLLCMSDAQRFAVNAQDAAFLLVAVAFALVAARSRTAARALRRAGGPIGVGVAQRVAP